MVSLHKVIGICAGALALSIMAVSCGPEKVPEPTPTPPNPSIPVEDIYLTAATRTKAITDPGATLAVEVDCNDEWDFALSEPYFMEVSRTKTELVLALDRLSFEGDRKIGINVYAKRAPEVKKELSVKVKSALGLDVAFADDGSAKDLSSNKMFIKQVEGSGAVVYKAGGKNVVKFYSELGGKSTEGYYKVDYSSGATLKNALADGYSVEVQFMLGQKNECSGDVMMFSSIGDGGTGVFLAAGSKDIAFSANVGGEWKVAKSGVVPEVGRYYHATGVWDKSAGKVRIYVDGELKSEVDAAGEFALSSSVAQRWFCIGGNCSSGNYADKSWNGDVVLSRVYDAVLRASDVAELRKSADVDFGTSEVKLEDILYLPLCVLPYGGEYTVYANGLKQADKLRFESLDGMHSATLDGVVKGDRLSVKFPTDFVAGKYKMTLLRGEGSAPVGLCELSFSKNARPVSRPEIVAHRGFHKTVMENSIPALEAAQKAGFDAVELDIWLTTDGRLVVNHDGKWNGKTVQDSSYGELAGIPTLEEFIVQARKYPKTKLVIEIKEHSSAKRNADCTAEMVRIVKEMGYESTAEYICFDLDVCKQIAAALPGTMVGYLSSTSDLQGLKAAGIMCADFSDSYLFNNPSLFETAHSLGMKVNIWTVNSEYDMKKAIGLGVDYITTDSPDDLQRILSRMF